MTKWVYSWLACSVIFAVFLVLFFWIGGFDNISYDKVFYFAIGAIFVTISTITAVFFRSESRRHFKNVKKQII